MDEIGYVFGQSLSQLPTLLVLLVGMILVGTARGRLPGRPRALALAGIGLLLLGVLLNILWALVFSRLVREGWTAREIGALGVGVSALLSVWHATGLGLVIGAVLAGRHATDSPTAVQTRPGDGTDQPGAGGQPAGAGSGSAARSSRDNPRVASRQPTA